MTLGPFTQGRRLIKRKRGAGFSAGRGQAAGTQSFQPGQGYAAGTPAPGSRAPIAAAAPTAPPPAANPLLDAQIQNLYAGRDIGLAGLNEAEKFLRLDFGLIQDANGNFAVDVGNPQAKAAMLQRSYQQARRGDLNSMAARGQLTSGAYLRQQGERNRGEQTDFASLVRAFTTGLGDIQRQRDSLSRDTDSRVLDLRLQHAGTIGGDSTQTSAAPPAASLTPKAGYQFVMKSGPRAGQSYNLRPGPDGKLWRYYANGDRERRT